MDQNEITMTMDVKMDLKEKKSEYFQLRVSTVMLIVLFNSTISNDNLEIKIRKHLKITC